jgi:hypothetical protein
MLDVFFLSYNEQYADKNFQKLVERVPHARRVHGVKGFYQAHRACAEQSLTHNFYVVDADAEIVDDFDFSFKPSKFNKWYDTNESDCLCVWSSINPINGLIYGYGGVKLLPKLPLLKTTNNTVDFTTGFGLNIKVFEQISNITAFNQDEFSTWRSAFRECTKLAINLTNEELKHKVKYDYSVLDKIYKDTNDRLDVWCSVGEDKPYGKYALAGGQCGKEFGLKHANDKETLKLINDYDWIKNEFDEFYK